MPGLFVQDRATSQHRPKTHNAKLGLSSDSCRERVNAKSILGYAFAAVFLVAVPSARAQQPAQPTPQASDRRHFTDDDRISMREWYRLHHDELPLGVRKKDRLPHDLQAQLKVNEVLAEVLRPRIHEVSSDFLGRVPPAADGCHYVFVGGNAVILERKSNYVYDIYNFRSKK